ncbi:MAG: NAD(+) synthase [Armatimonadota bacterium]|nr:NAD(+) synthase [bacterium]
MAVDIARPLAGQVSVWMQDRVREAGAKGLVLGMSGGIDSSVVAVLAKMACGDNVLGMIMPCHSNPASAEDAKLVARKFGIKTHFADLTATYDVLVPRIPHVEGFELTNVRPRLRMTALYCAAQALGYLVAGTSNKTELAIGYYTKWGDGGSDILPLGNFFKHQVYQLAREIDMPQEVMDKAPTADLWEGQTDENEIGMTYSEIDAILAALESGELSGFDPASVKRVRTLIAESEHKRCPIPRFQP